MADSNRSRTMLMKNLPKKGWNIEGNTGTFKGLRIEFGDNEWTIYKDDKPAVTGDYGRTQMSDVRAACKSLGCAFEDDKSPDKAVPKKSKEEKKASAKEKQKAAMDRKKSKQPEDRPPESDEGIIDTPSEEEKENTDPEG